MLDSKVSIIVPVYNTEKYIRNTLESIVNQTYQNLDVICVDDSSPDNAVAIAEEYASKFGYIRVVHNSNNLGLEETRNHGLRVADGQYVTFLDSDDTIDPDMIERMLEIASNGNYDIVISSYKRIVDNDPRDIVSSMSTGEYTVADFLKSALDGFSNDIISCVGTKMYNLDFIRQHNIRFDKYYKYNEDMGFILTAISNTEKIFFLNHPFYNYMIRGTGSIMSSYRPNMFKSIIHIWEKYKTLFTQYNIYDSKRYLVNFNIYVLMLASLINERKFNSVAEIKKVFNDIRQYNGFNEVYDVLINSPKTCSKHRIILKAIRNNAFWLVFLLLSVRKEETRR